MTKHPYRYGVLLLCVLAARCVTPAHACTNFLVGRKASADGSVMVSYNADNYGMYGDMYRHVGSKHRPGEMRKIYEWDTNRYLGELPQATQTYNVIGQMNANQVTVTETTFGGREELCDSTGLIDYGSLMYIALERSQTAREAIEMMTSLVEKYGYCSEGESFSVADKTEAWILEMVGKGPGSKGAVWVAVRIPDDCIAAHANQSRITRFDRNDKQNVLYAKDVISFARKKGYFSGKDEDFSFRDAYCPLDFGNIRYCDARVWSFFNRNADGMEKYLPYIDGEDMTMDFPLYVKPNHLLSVQDVQNCMRDHYENTPLEMTKDLGAGAYEMPYRPRPLQRTVDGTDYFNERPTSTQQTGFSFVGQMRSFLPDAIGGIIWWTHDDANMAAYTPVYCCATDIPQCYRRIQEKQDELTFSWESAYWVCNVVANIIYPYYNKMFPDLLAARNELEEGFRNNQMRIETQAKSLYDESPEQAVAFLTQYSLDSAQKMLSRWQQLFTYIVVKHNDMVVKPEENGHFKRTADGLGASVRNVGYSNDYWHKIIRETGDRYLYKTDK